MTEFVSTPFVLPGSAGEPMYGDAVCAKGASPKLTVLFGHGFKGFRGYGFIPVLTRMLAGSVPVAVCRFNFSHAGFAKDQSVFGRPDLFQQDTWNKQAADWRTLLCAAHAGALPAALAGAPVVLLGHSRGGASSLLAAGRAFRDGDSNAIAALAGVVSVGAPSRTLRFTPEQRHRILDQGGMTALSSRTGQQLRIDARWLQEQIDDPDGHDIAGLSGLVDRPVLAVHGTADETVPPSCAGAIAAASPQGVAAMIKGMDHVCDTPHPWVAGAPVSGGLAAVHELVSAWCAERIAEPRR